MVRVEGRCVVTGASRGIGLAFVKNLCRNEKVVEVYAGCRTPDTASGLIELRKEFPKLTVLPLDVCDDRSIEKFVEEVRKGGDKLNVVINNAGILEEFGGDVEGAQRDVWAKHFDTNITSYAKVAQALIPLIQNASGTLLNVTGRKGSIQNCPGTKKIKFQNIAYGCTKASVNYMTRCISFDYPEMFIVAMCPGWSRTDMGGPDGEVAPEEGTAAVLKTLDTLPQSVSGHYLDRFGKPINY